MKTNRSAILSLFEKPDKEVDFDRYKVYMITLSWCTVICVIDLVGVILVPDNSDRYLSFLGIIFFIGLVTLVINAKGYSDLGSWIFSSMIWLFITIPIYTTGGIKSPGIISQVSVVITAGFLVGWRGAMIFGVLSLAIALHVVYLEVNDLLPEPVIIFTPLMRWTGALIPFGTILLIQFFATNYLRKNLEFLNEEIERRELTEREKDEMLLELDERVKELATLYQVSKILQDNSQNLTQQLERMAQTITLGWQFSEFASTKITLGERSYFSEKYQESSNAIKSQNKTAKGTNVTIEVAYPDLKDLQFLKEEHELIQMLTDFLTIELERREENKELNDYKYAIDIASSVCVFSQDGNIQSCNENFSKQSKFTVPEQKAEDGRMFTEIFPFLNMHKIRQNCNDGKPYRGEFILKAKSGEVFWVDGTIVPFQDENGRIYQYLSLNYDITTQKLAIEKIKESEENLRKITSMVPGNTYVVKLNEEGISKLLFINHGVDSSLLGYNKEDALSNPNIIFKVVHPDDLVKFKTNLREAYTNNSPYSFYFRALIGNSIQWRWMQAIPEKDKSGETVWYGSTHEITPIVEYIESIEQIIFDISHVIRRPISNLKGILNLIQQDSFTQKEFSELVKALEDISQELDEYSKELNLAYEKKRESNKFRIDIPVQIDSRGKLFGA